jgi:hypothetical protein
MAMNRGRRLRWCWSEQPFQRGRFRFRYAAAQPPLMLSSARRMARHLAGRNAARSPSQPRAAFLPRLGDVPVEEPHPPDFSIGAERGRSRIRRLPERGSSNRRDDARRNRSGIRDQSQQSAHARRSAGAAQARAGPGHTKARPVPLDGPARVIIVPARSNPVQLGQLGVVGGGLGEGSRGKTWGRRGWRFERGPWYAARLGNRRPRWRTMRGQARSRRVSARGPKARTATASRTVAARRDGRRQPPGPPSRPVCPRAGAHRAQDALGRACSDHVGPTGSQTRSPAYLTTR